MALWRNVTIFGLLGGLMLGGIVTIYLLVTIEYGPDWIAQNGDEPIWLLPWGEISLKPAESSIPGFFAAIIAILLISTIETKVRKMREK
jgi:Na+/proline symporter